MEIVTFVVDCTTLVNNIHNLKKWVYEGDIRLFVPICSMLSPIPLDFLSNEATAWEAAEQQYKASLIPASKLKESTTKRVPGKAARKDYPLFDINPRTAWEFLSRANTDNGVPGVSFQVQEQEFTQWKEDEQKLQKAESPPAAPTSFAEALLRKLNINDDEDANGSKGSRICF
jgi:hypothetical protein